MPIAGIRAAQRAYRRSGGGMPPGIGKIIFGVIAFIVIFFGLLQYFCEAHK